MIIKPKSPLLNPALVRPDWQRTTPRPTGPLWLDKNENPDVKLLEVTTTVLRELDPIALSTYPECGGLYRKLAQWLEVSPEYLMLTPGSDGAIRFVFEAFVSEGDTVVHPLPTFAMYSVYSQMFGVKVDPLNYERHASGPRLNTGQLLSHLERVRPRLFCLPNPDSPTGTVISPDDLRAVVDLCSRIGTVVLVDEAYHPFYDWTCAKWTHEYRNLIVARTFAKAWGLAGLRIGYAIGHPDTVQFLHKLRPMYEASTLSIAFMERMLDHVDEMWASVRRLNEGKRYFAGEMARLGFNVLSTHGNFQHVAFGPGADAVHRALENRVLYRKDFKEDCLKGYSRFSAATIDQFAPIVSAIRSVAVEEHT